MITAGDAMMGVGRTVARDTCVETPVRQAIPRYLDLKALQKSRRMDQLTVQTDRTMAGLYTLEKEWRALEQRAEDGRNAFQNFDWCVCWSETFINDQHLADLHIVTVRDKDRLVLVWPLMMTCVGPVCVLRWLSDPYGQYGDVLVDPDYAHTDVFDAAWQHIHVTSKADALRLRHVRQDSRIHDYLLERCGIADEPQMAPALDMHLIRDEPAYDARYTKEQRRRRRRIRAALQKRGELQFQISSLHEALCNSAGLAIEHKREWLRQRGLYSEPLNNDGLEDFLLRLARRCGDSLHLVSSRIKVGGQAISHQIGLRYFGRHLCYLTSHDHRFTDLSPARLHMDFAQRAAIGVKTQVFDLMVPGDAYKKAWSNGEVQVCDFYSASSLKGKLFANAYLSILRPLVRRVYHAMPPGVRSRLFSLI